MNLGLYYYRPVDFKSLELSIARFGANLLEKALTKARVVLLLVILLIGGASAYYIAQKTLPKNNNNPPTATPTPRTSPTPAPTMASGEKGNLEITMTLDKTSFSLGESVNLTLAIINISSQTISFTDTGLNFDFQVYNGTNNLVYQWSNFRAIPQFVAIVPLPSGQNISANFTWPQTCNFNTQVNGDTVSPGTYSIIGETGPTYGIQTTPIQITIGDP